MALLSLQSRTSSSTVRVMRPPARPRAPLSPRSQLLPRCAHPRQGKATGGRRLTSDPERSQVRGGRASGHYLDGSGQPTDACVSPSRHRRPGARPWHGGPLLGQQPCERAGGKGLAAVPRGPRPLCPQNWGRGTARALCLGPGACLGRDSLRRAVGGGATGWGPGS